MSCSKIKSLLVGIFGKLAHLENNSKKKFMVSRLPLNANPNRKIVIFVKSHDIC